jgi:rhodanese-related sulfurtransferase
MELKNKMFGLFGGGNKVEPEVLKENIGNKEVLILDVRTKDEFKGGHIKGAKNVPVEIIDTRLKEIEAYKDKQVLVYCHSGARSARAASFLRSAGFSDVKDMKGGIMNWRYETVK